MQALSDSEQFDDVCIRSYTIPACNIRTDGQICDNSSLSRSACIGMLRAIKPKTREKIRRTSFGVDLCNTGNGTRICLIVTIFRHQRLWRRYCI